MDKKDKTKEIWIPFLSLIIAAFGILSGVVFNIAQEHNKFKLKYYEITYIEKQKLYSNFLKSFSDLFEVATSQPKIIDPQHTYFRSVDRLQVVFFSMEPFVKSDKNRELFWEKLQEYNSFCNELYLRNNLKLDDKEAAKATVNFTNQRTGFRKILMKEFFEDIQ